MKPILFLTSLLLISFSIDAQSMRSLTELINANEPAWPNVQQWIDSASNSVEVLPADSSQAANALFHTQVTTRSPMGAIVYMTGGILIDNGWIRILGSGNEKLSRSIPDWNKGKTFSEFGDPMSILLIADDAIGGFFLLNGGGLGSDIGKVYYWAPESLTFQPLELTYTEFLNFCFNGDLDAFYEGFRWENWETEVAAISGDQAISFYPFLWTVQGKNPATNARKAITIEEQYRLNLDFTKQLNPADIPDGLK